MEFELKSFEEKINDITEQFMSLLDSNNVVEDSINAKFDNMTKGEPAVSGMPSGYGAPTGDVNGAYNSTGHTITSNGEPYKFASGITYGNGESHEDIPSHAIKFDEIEDLNRRLEELYNSRKGETVQYKIEPGLTFADYGVGTTKTEPNNDSRITNDKIYSANEKEGISMANYGYNGDDNSIFSFATVPQERALAPQRSFSDILFMDIPWDTKLDVWGGIKSFFNTTVKFTF